MHLFSSDTVSEDYHTTSTYRILAAVANRPPRSTPIEYHIATSRFLLGEGLADRLALPQTSRATAWHVRRTGWLQWALVAFGRMYATRWEVERVACTRTLVSMIVCWQLGSKRTRFTIKTFGADAVVPVVQLMEKGEGEEVGEGEKETGREKEKEVDPDDDELDPEVKMGPEAGKRIVARWRWLLLEMMGWVVGLPLTSVLMVAYAWSRSSG